MKSTTAVILVALAAILSISHGAKPSLPFLRQLRDAAAKRILLEHTSKALAGTISAKLHGNSITNSKQEVLATVLPPFPEEPLILDPVDLDLADLNEEGSEVLTGSFKTTDGVARGLHTITDEVTLSDQLDKIAYNFGATQLAVEAKYALSAKADLGEENGVVPVTGAGNLTAAVGGLTFGAQIGFEVALAPAAGEVTFTTVALTLNLGSATFYAQDLGICERKATDEEWEELNGNLKAILVGEFNANRGALETAVKDALNELLDCTLPIGGEFTCTGTGKQLGSGRGRGHLAHAAVAYFSPRVLAEVGPLDTICSQINSASGIWVSSATILFAFVLRVLV